MNDKDEEFLSPGQAAKQLMVSPAAIRIWAEKGEIHALTTPGGHRRFLQSEVDRFAEERGLVYKGAPQSQLSILIVDDDVQFTRYLTKLLSGYDVEVQVVNNGFDAGIKVRDMAPHIILLDLMIPGINGFEVCKGIKSSVLTAKTRVIAMTGNPSVENVDKILAAGADVCLAKPIERDDLLELLGLI